MATLEFSESGGVAAAFDLQEWFNVERTVSMFTRSDLQDVKLVQVLLHMIYFRSTGSFSKPSQQRPNELLDDANLEPDGLCGRMTNRWIKSFQADRNSRGRFASSHFDLLATDGMVSPAPGGDSIVSPRTGHLFTIAALNIVCKSRDPIGFQQLLNSGVDGMAARLLHSQLGE
jgi:hypothetical protein